MATKVSQQSAQTDLGRLWAEAIRDYNARTKEDLSALGARSVAEVMRQTDTDMKKFKGFRDDGSKMSSFRSAMGDHLGDFQKCIDGFAAVGAAVSAFPPAMPVGLVFTAASRLISAFAGVRAEYDRVEEFFAYSARFFERLSILEGRAQSGPLAIAIVRIFSMQLSVCGRVRRLVKEKKITHWLNALWNEVDEELVSAYAAMQASIQEPDEAVGFESYSSIKTVQDDVLVNSAKLDELDKKLQSYRESVGKDIQQVYASTLNLQVVVSEGFSAIQYQLSENHVEQNALLRQILKNTAKLSRAPENEEKKKQEVKSKGDVGDRKFQALRELKKFFNGNSNVFPSWVEAHQENLTQNEDMRDNKVGQTAAWLARHPNFETWIDGAYSVIEMLRLRHNEHTSLAYFYFKEEHPYQQSMQNAFASAALQIAESNSKYAEQVAAMIREDSSESTELSTWKRFFLSMFPGDNRSGSRLFLVLDGLDEAHVQEGGVLTQFLTDLKHQGANVSVLATSRPEDKPTLQLLQPSMIDITKQEMKSDIKMLVKSRLQTLPRVRKFSPHVKKAIARKIVKQADSMLYVEHMLRRFSYIGRERAVMHDLDKLPTSLHALYKLLFEECRHNRSEAQYQALKKLFAWLAFSKRSLSLAEASSLIKLTLSDDDTFDIEEEIIGRSSRILELTQTRQIEEDVKDDDQDDDENDEEKDDSIPEVEDGKSPLTFQDRSLRQYFQSVNVEDDGVTEFRTPATTAHLTILQMCVDIMMEAAKDPNEPTTAELSLYAIRYWHDHLKDLDVENTTTEAIQQVVILLHRITRNESNIAKLFEKIARHTDIYPVSADDTPTPWFETLITVLTVTEDNVLLPLAQGHVQNWLDADDQVWIPESFLFVKGALSHANRIEVSEDEPIKYINAITAEYDIPAEDFKTLRATGSTLADYGYAAEDPDRQKSLITEAAVYLKRAVECMEGDVLEKVATLRLLAPKYEWIDQKPEAMKYYDQAYDMLLTPDNEDLSHEELIKIKKIQIELMTMKAQVLSNMEKREDALLSFDEARRLSGDQPLAGSVLDDITLLFQENNEAEASRLMEVLKSWNERERNSWFTYCFEEWVDEDAVTRMQRAAKSTKETDLLLDWLSALARMLSMQSLHLFNLRCAIAYIYYPMLGDIEKGKALRNEILAMKPKPDPVFEDTMNETKTSHRMQLADILFCEFQMSADPTKKETIMETLGVLPSAHGDNYDERESHVGMLRANMFRIMGPAKEYEKHMNELLTNCIRGLEDSVSWNDSSSLRLLSKVLASLDGLEKDARIAISAQFSILDRAIHEQDAESEPSESLSDSGVHEVDTEKEPTKNIELLTGSDDNLHAPLADSIHKAADKSPSEGVEKEQNPIVTAEVPEPAKIDEDVAGWGIFCDGRCGVTIKSWTQPFYYCLVCPSCDLCEDCHSKRLEQTAGEIGEPWLSFCGANHRYIKGPMKDWKGIKNGVIRIGNEEIAVRDWLRGLKEERWQNAWKTFWTRQGGLKDIGME
ncbi:unnamed protein product [Alternaria alternata]